MPENLEKGNTNLEKLQNVKKLKNTGKSRKY